MPWRLYKKAISNELRFPVRYLYEDVATTYKAFMLVLIDANGYAYRHQANSIIWMKFDERKINAIDISKVLYSDICKFRLKLKKAAESQWIIQFFTGNENR